MNSSGTTGWVRICPAADLAPGQVFAGEVNGRPLAVFNDAGVLRALDDRCTHEHTRLSAGPVQAGQVFCPRHGARFCLRTGRALSPPASGAVACWDVRIAAQWIEVRLPLPRANPAN